MTHRLYVIAFLLVSVVGGFCPAGDLDDRIDALQEKFEARYPQLRALKEDGIIGETAEGFVAFVQGEVAEASKVVNEENSDRRDLYELIAQKEETTPQKVAERNARRNFRNALKGEYLRDKNGKWKQKEADGGA